MKAILLCLAVVSAAARLRADAPAGAFSHPDRVRYDGQCFTIDWTLAREWAGVASGWPEAGPGKTPGWRTLPLNSRRPMTRKGGLDGTPSGPADALAMWYKVEFRLPASPDGEWIPWRALIDAAGDGLVYLNGRSLGRYWEQGPQREYYLPECWLRFGEGAPNMLTFCLSPMRKGVALRAVEVSPYEDQAEMRAGGETGRR